MSILFTFLLAACSDVDIRHPRCDSSSVTDVPSSEELAPGVSAVALESVLSARSPLSVTYTLDDDTTVDDTLTMQWSVDSVQRATLTGTSFAGWQCPNGEVLLARFTWTTTSPEGVDASGETVEWIIEPDGRAAIDPGASITFDSNAAWHARAAAVRSGMDAESFHISLDAAELNVVEASADPWSGLLQVNGIETFGDGYQGMVGARFGTWAETTP